MDIEIVFESIILGVMIILAVIGSSGVCWVTYDTFKSEPITGKSSLPKSEKLLRGSRINSKTVL